MKYSVTDTELLAAVSHFGGGQATYVIRNVLSAKHRNLETQSVRRHLQRLEKRGMVRRAKTAYAVMICWEAHP